MITKLLPGTIFMLLLTACNNNATTEGSNGSGDSISSKQTEGTTIQKTKKARSSIKLIVTGGDMAGTYEATCMESCCSYGIAGKKIFGNQYSESGKGPRELSSVQMIIDDVTGNKSTTEFLVTVSFGELFGEDSKSFTIDSKSSEGSGKLDLEYANEKAKIKMKGTTKEGVQLDLTMECFKVITPDNLAENLE